MTAAHQNSPSELRSHLGFWLRAVSNHVSQAFAQKLLDSGVTVAEWVILREMLGHEGTVPSDLAEMTGLTRGAISKLVDRLIAKKLLTRTSVKEDHRFQTLALTAAGIKLVPVLAEIADRNDEEFFSVLSPKARNRLRKSLTKLAQEHGLKTPPME